MGATHHVVQIEKPGGCDQLRYAEAIRPVPGENQVLVRNTFVGVNFIDTYHR